MPNSFAWYKRSYDFTKGYDFEDSKYSPFSINGVGAMEESLSFNTIISFYDKY